MTKKGGHLPSFFRGWIQEENPSPAADVFIDHFFYRVGGLFLKDGGFTAFKKADDGSPTQNIEVDVTIVVVDVAIAQTNVERGAGIRIIFLI